MTRPTRSFPAAVSQCLIALCLAGLGLIASVTWLYIAAAVVAVGIVGGVALAISGASRSRLKAIDAPAVAIAGEETLITVDTRSPQAVVFELRDGPQLIARWRQPAGEHRRQIPVRFGSRGVVEELVVSVRCAGPFGTWTWVRHDRVSPAEPIAVGPAPATSAPRPASLKAGDGSGHASRPGSEPGELLGLRPWADGDPIGWVHWLSAARGEQVLVRQWQPPARIATEVEVERHDDPVDAEHAAAQASGQIEAALQSQSDVRLTVPSPGGSSTTTVHDRWAAAKALAEADLPRHQEPNQPNAPDPNETSRAARVAVSGAVFVACVTIARSTERPALMWIVALFILPTLTALRLWHHPRRVWAIRAISIAVGAVTLVRFARAAAAAGSNEIFAVGEALVEILTVLVAVRTATGDERRVLRFGLGTSAALIGFSAAVRFDPSFSWAISSWVVLVAAAFVAVHRSETLTESTTVPPVPPASARQRSLRVAATAGGAALVVALAFIALVAVPIPQGPIRLLSPSRVPQFLRVPSDGGLAAQNADGEVVESTPNDPVPSAAFGYSAFTASFDLSQRGRPGNDVVMRVRAPAPDFWRAQTFETFDGRRWIVAPESGVQRRGPVIDVPPQQGDVAAPTERFVQTFMLELDMPNLIFAASRPSQILLDADVWVRPDGALRANTVLPAGTQYTVVSQRVTVTAELLRRQASPDDPTWGTVWQPPGSERYLQLPTTTTQRVRDLTLSITDPYPAVYDKIQAIESWLAANVEYDLDAPIPPEGSDAVDHFLFESRRGFCEQIASALVVMLRSIGVPSRVAAGYIPGERDPFAGVWVVREGDAHAWAEVWFPATGWKAFDPTAAVPFAGETSGPQSLGFPIVEASLRFVVRWAPLATVLLLIAVALAWLIRGLRHAARGQRDPAWAAQRRFEQLCRRAKVSIAPADTNEALAARLALLQPGAGPAALAAAGAIDAAVFGSVDPNEAKRAVAELAHTHTNRSAAVGSTG